MPTSTRAAVLWGAGEDWKIEEVDLDDPGPGEVLVKTGVAGMCHSDEHVVTGDMPAARTSRSSADTRAPASSSAVGAGRHHRRGRATTSAMSFIPALRALPAGASTGRQNLCDEGAKLFDMRHDARTRRSGPHDR